MVEKSNYKIRSPAVPGGVTTRRPWWMEKRELRNTRKTRKGNQAVDRLKADRLKEKTCAIIISLQSSALPL
jgi:hypothetical protein